ncbi:MAG: hypothetical protein HY928_09075 [Elusimicrobia bacterium]|nr:hypothetical protein [Elusimicrobiota bacterium]
MSGLADFARLNPDPMLKTDPAGRPTYLNPAAKALFPELAVPGAAHALLAGWPEVAGFLAAHDDQVPFVRRVAVGARVYEEHIFHARGRSEFWMYVNDVTEREQVEHLKQEFLQNVCHELNTPLTCLCGCLQSLAADLDGALAPEQRAFMQIAIRGAQHLADMVNDLTDSALLERGRLRIEPRRTEVGPIVADAVAVFARSGNHGCALTAEVPPDLPPVLADPVRLRQVLNNLISNARKFTPGDGTVRVRLRPCPDDAAFLQISVDDTGCGIAPQDAGRVFERLFQARSDGPRPRGLGIGLYVCRELVAGQGGKIWLESRPGVGSSFHFTLPLFSIARLLEPLSAMGPLGALSQLTLELFEPGRVLEARLRHEVMQSARDAVGGLLGVDEVLLPEAAEVGAEGRLFVLSRKDLGTVQRLGRRLEARLAGVTACLRSGPTPSVRAECIPLPAGRDWAEAAGRAVEERMRREALGRAHECSPG